jgi:ADP-heptose:LPS heptosyltransferase
MDGQMNISGMKKIDRWVGWPACWLLKVVNYFAGAKPATKVERVAVVKFFGMGSMILAIPLLRALRQAYPDAKIGFATLGSNKEFVEMLNLTDEGIYLSLPKSAPGIFFGIVAFFLKLRAFKPQLVIDLEYLTRFSALASYLSGAETRVGFHSWDVWRGGLHNIRASFNPYWHASENFLNLARKAAGRDFKLTMDFELPVNREAAEKVAKILAEAGFKKGEKLILVNPNASTIALERRWPKESFEQLIERILASGLGRVALIGGPDEREFVEGLRRELKNPDSCLNLAGLMNLRELMELVRGADLLVTNDSGPVHIASLLHTKTVSFFGPETPTLFGPLGEGHKVLYRGIDCSPCISVYNAKTVRCIRGKPECVSEISPDQAFEAVREVLGKQK